MNTKAPDTTYITDQLRRFAVPIEDLVVDPANVRRHPQRNLEAIKGSLTRFGQRIPLVVQKQGMIVRSGNGRLQAAREMGWTHIAAIVVDESDVTATAFAIADNRSSDLAEWDIDGLAAQLESLETDGFEIADIGFMDGDLDALLAELDSPPDLPPPLPPPINEPPPLPEGADDIPDNVEPLTEEGEEIALGPHVLHCADCIEVMKGLDDNSVDAVVTDPPYGIAYMGKGFDKLGDAAAQREWHKQWAAEALRVCKPGAHLIAFCANRTLHYLMAGLEEAGWEIRDLVGWLTWQGFPKSLDIGAAIAETVGAEAAEQWDGWGTALKPASEPFVLARKPLDGTIAQNVAKWGTGGLNIEACRIKHGDPAWPPPVNVDEERAGDGKGRWPANVYYCPKPQAAEREEGCDDLPAQAPNAVTGRKADSPGQKHARAGMTGIRPRRNHHPTVKPAKLMRWLLQLVSPPGAVVLEPFAGSGTAFVAAEGLPLQLIAAEKEPAYCDVARARATWAQLTPAQREKGGPPSKAVFRYYGSKNGMVTRYPAPRHETIIEPFAGAAGYSQYHWQNRVILYDADPTIVSVWEYLIKATHEDVLALPDVTPITNVRELDIEEGAKNLIGFWIGQGLAVPNKRPNKRAIEQGLWNKDKPKIAELVHRFDHWEVHNASYVDIPNHEATWFIDPPYQHGGHAYKCSQVDFSDIAKFAQNRQGEVIVCENTKADWMDFEPLFMLNGVRFKTVEAIYYMRDGKRMTVAELVEEHKDG